MLRIIDCVADAWNSFGTVEEMPERNSLLEAESARVGRDPKSIVRAAHGWAAMLPSAPRDSVEALKHLAGRYADAGVNEFLIEQPRPEQQAVVERVAAEVLPSPP
jgi:hypothetical protein